MSRNLILAVITISIVTTLTLTTIFIGGSLSVHDHLALAQSVNNPQQHEENKDTQQLAKMIMTTTTEMDMETRLRQKTRWSQ